MRIIGGKDYYDGVMAYGQDDAVFVRKRHTDVEGVLASDVPLSHPGDYRWLRMNVRRRTDGELHAIPTVIWFAGQRYTAIELVERFSVGKGELYWDKQSFLERMKETTRKRPRELAILGPASQRKTVDAIFDTRATDQERSWLIDNGISIAIGRHPFGEDEFRWWFDTDGLKDLGFAKILDPFTAYQELSMWVGGILSGPERPTVDISDSDKIAKRGFDKWSFRKMPSR